MAFPALGKIIKDLRMTNLPIFEIDDSINPIETSKEPIKKPDKKIIQNEVIDAKKILSNEYADIGRIIAEEMDTQEYHPVIIFGSSNSGKSTFLASLFSYFQVSMANGIGIYLGDSLIPLNTSHGKAAFADAERFFHQQQQTFLDGEAHLQTKALRPFFIPVKVKPPKLPEMKFAFMESSGEWYQVDETTGKYFPELKEEINAILKSYQKGISFIHIAPFTQLNQSASDETLDTLDDKKLLNAANLALVGAFNSYEQLRVYREDDDHVFLVTKWDIATKNNPIDGLSNIDEDQLVGFAENIYRKGYAALQNLHIHKDQRAILPYCAGIMHGRTIIKPNDVLRPIIDVFPKKLWNRLYGNATKCNLDIGNKLILIEAPIPPKKTMFDLMGNLINKILH